MIRFCTFREDETRTFAPASSMFDAVNKVRNNQADGMTVDVVNESGDYRRSYEIMPGRSIVAWFGDECW